MRFRLSGWVLIGVILVSGSLCSRSAAAAQENESLYALTEENDGILGGQDRHYTQGFMFTRTVTAPGQGLWGELSDALDRVSGWLGAGPEWERRYRWPIVGQSLFTPADLKTLAPQPNDRPFAAWLYAGVGLQRRSINGRLDQFQLLLGVVGPLAMGERAQNKFHHIFGFSRAQGWNNQLHNEPGLLARYQASWDLPLWYQGSLEGDLLPEAGMAVGNILTYGDAGVTLRLGQGLAAAGTPQTITPGLSGSGWFDPAALNGPFGWMLMAGIQTRAVWRNLFLQGNTFRHSPSVRMRHFVTDEDVGVSLLFRLGLRVDVVYVKRSHEFYGQAGDDRFGSVTLSVPVQ